MGCSSDQYASMERYLIEKARISKERGDKFFLVYENIPKSKLFIDDFVKKGGRLYYMKLNSFFDVSYYKKISKIIKNEEIDLIHSYFTPTCHYINIYLTMKRTKKLVRTAANLPISLNNRKKSQKAYFLFLFSIRQRLLSLFAKKIMCRSKGVMKELKELGISSDKLVVTSGGVNTEFYRFSPDSRWKVRKSYSINDHTLVLGAFCRFITAKRLDELIRAYANLRIPGQEIVLLIAGDGPEEEGLKKLVKNLNLNSQIKFLGHRNDIRELYSALDIFCLASRGEGMSNSILEAMASELPIIASDITPNRELIEEDLGGYLISFKNDIEFSNRIEKLTNKKIRENMGAYNRKKVISQYSVNSRLEKEFQIYEELIN